MNRILLSCQSGNPGNPDSDNEKKRIINYQFMKRILLLAFALLLGGAMNGAMAQNDDANEDGFHDGDGAIVNAIIQNNRLQGYEANAPKTWDFVYWDGVPPQRIARLRRVTVNFGEESAELSVSPSSLDFAAD
jgi:hypothetical protein